jgi:Beta-lactamase enzyme family
MGSGTGAPQLGRLPSLRMGSHSAFAAVLVMVAGLPCAACSGTASGDTVPTRSAAPAGAATTPARPPSAQLRASFAAALAPLRRTDHGHIAAAVYDLTTGLQAADGGRVQFVTASIVKVDILAALLYQAQHGGQALTENEQELATTMIENSNNDAASDLYYDAGGAAGIDEVNRALGLTDTAVGTDGYWGLTTTTADDQIKLLRDVFTSSSPLWRSSRRYIQSLMSNVEADQRWGIPAAASPGTPYMVKNGWLPNPALWEINSIGEIRRDGQRLLIAVLSDDNATEDGGISVVETAARAAARSATKA